MSQTASVRSLDEISSCLSGYDPQALPVEQARAFIDALVEPITEQEKLPLRSALGRVLAEDVVSTINVPSHDNSAMDGYAFRGAELNADGDTRFSVAGAGFAGDGVLSAIEAGQCVRIMTGAIMPADLDTVIPQEFVQLDGNQIVIPAGVVKAGDNRRLAGEDLAQGEVALHRGRRIRPADLGLMASLGKAEVTVYRPLRVAFFSTGNELRSIGETLDDGCVFDSNRYTLWGMLSQLDVQLMDLGVVKDNRASLTDAFERAAAQADVVITSGGVSVGEADYTKQIMAELGEVLFWRIAMRPGRPMAIGRLQSRKNGNTALLFGLPGNPVAVMVTFYAFVREALMKKAGSVGERLPLMRVKTTMPIRKRAGRTEFQRGTLAPDAAGEWAVSLTGAQGSGVLRSMSQANCLIVLGHEQQSVGAGEPVDVMLFDGLI